MIAKIVGELHRRKVFRAAVGYVAASWIIVEAADFVVDVFDAPEWIVAGAIAMVAVGLLPALAFSWFYEITEDGIQRTRPAESPDVVEPLRQADRRINFAIILMLVAALGLSIYGNVKSPDLPNETVSVLIADFENQTDNELFSGVMEDFLLVGLEVAPFVSAYSRDDAGAIAESLTGSDTTADALDADTATLVALREGIDVVVSGAVSRSNNELTIVVNTVAAGDQREMFSIVETAASDADVLNVIVEIAKQLRKRLARSTSSLGAGDAESFAVTNLEAAAEYLIAQDLQRDRKLVESARHYRKAIAFDPDFTRAYAGLAITEQYLGNTGEAARNWSEALSRLDRLTERGRLRTLGNYFMINQGNFEKALESYEALVAKYPGDNVAQNNLAVTAFYSMDFQRALEVGREVAKRFKGQSGYAANLALYALYASRFDEARQVASDVIERDPANAYSHFVLAQTSAMAGDYADAESTYREMMEFGQFARAVAAEGLADLALHNGDAAGAVTILDEAIAAEQELGSSHSVALKQAFAVQAHLELGQADEARARIDDLLEAGHSDPAVLVPVALALIELGDTDTAEAIAESLEQSLSKPRRAYALAIRSRVASSRDDDESAIALADEGVDTVDLWLVRYLRAKTLIDAGQLNDASADLETCNERVGEGITAFLNDRPTFYLMRDFEASRAAAATTSP